GRPAYKIVHDMLKWHSPCIVESVDDNSVFKGRRFAVEHNIKACVATALRVGGRETGVMFINYQMPRRFTQNEIETMTLFANLAAVAIRSVQLFEKRTSELRKQEYLLRLTREFLGTTDLQVTLDGAVAVAAKALGTK